MAETLHIYTRVSTVVQADEGMSLDVQRDIGIERAKSLGFEFKLWNEGGRSSNHEEIDKRPVLSQVYDGIRKGVIKHLFVYDQSRLSRNDNVSSIFRYECNKQGVTLYNKEGKYDLGNPQDQFLKQILDAVGQFDNAQRTERTRLGKIGRIRQGNWMGGPPPFGYEIRDKKLVIEAAEAKWVTRIFEMYANRISTMDIKIELDANGVSPRRKLGTWSIGSLQALMRNTHYIGFWHYKDAKSGEVIKVDSPRILSTELWSKVKETRDFYTARRSDNGVKHFYMLKRVLRCGHCGTWLSGIYSGEQSKNHYYCPKKERMWTKNPINQEDKWERGRVCTMTRSLNIHDTDELVWNTVVDVLSRSKIVRERIKVEVLGDGLASSLSYELELNAAKAKLKKMKKYGCDIILYGFEAISQDILNSYRKGITRNDMINAIMLTREADIKVGGLFIIGAPEETKESLTFLFNFCKEFKEVTRVKYLSALPGTPLYYQCIKDGLIKDEIEHLDWLSREQSIEEDIDEKGFLFMANNITKEELREAYHAINERIEVRPYRYWEDENTYLDNPEKFLKRKK